MTVPLSILAIVSLFMALRRPQARGCASKPPGLPGARPCPRPREAAFTYPEIMIAMGLFSLVVIGVVYSQLFGMRMFNITSTRVSASDNARKVLDHVRDDVRSGKMLYVGNGDSAHFTNILLNGLRQGNALQIYPTKDTNVFVRYYMDTANQCLSRMASGTGRVQVLAPYLTNRVAFIAEDCVGRTLTNDQNNRVIKMVLDFYQWEFPMAQAGAGAFYDSYHVQTRITRRTIE
jgi:type II secretory pathway pseudopilin PulG